MNVACMEEMRNGYKILGEKLEGKRTALKTME
jgi:hypothetical protein